MTWRGSRSTVVAHAGVLYNAVVVGLPGEGSNHVVARQEEEDLVPGAVVGSEEGATVPVAPEEEDSVPEAKVGEGAVSVDRAEEALDRVVDPGADRVVARPEAVLVVVDAAEEAQEEEGEEVDSTSQRTFPIKTVSERFQFIFQIILWSL